MIWLWLFIQFFSNPPGFLNTYELPERQEEIGHQPCLRSIDGPTASTKRKMTRVDVLFWGIKIGGLRERWCLMLKWWWSMKWNGPQMKNIRITSNLTHI
jgi:hypothetical protein